MPSQDHQLGQRLSYDGVLCTVRFVGPVTGTTGTWLGVEWDDPSRGKHDGSHKGQRYFQCRSSSPTAASFVRPTRPAEQPRSFLDALQDKYVATTTTTTASTATAPPTRQIVISGKVAEEIGFDKIRRQQAQLGELRIVILDGMRIDEQGDKDEPIRHVCPKVVELDLSRNLFTGFRAIVDICAQLKELRGLRLNGNRFQKILQDVSLDQADPTTVFPGVKELAVDETMMQWDEMCHLAAKFPSLTTLYASTNQLSKLSHIPASWPLRTTLTSVYLEFNDFTSLMDVASLTSLSSLKNLYLKGNHISTMVSSSDTTEGDDDDNAPPSPPVFSKTLTYLDISYNRIHHWSFVDALPDVFPGLTSLRLAHNPVYDNPGFSSSSPNNKTAATNNTNTNSSSTVTEEAYMITVARLAALRSLNFSAVTPTDRTNAEMFYLSRIGRQLASVPEKDEPKIIAAQHRRYEELCEIYGAPVVVRRKEVNPAFLEARLIGTTFRFRSRPKVAAAAAAEEEKKQEEETKVVQIPKTFDIYAVKGIAGRLFGYDEPLGLKLVWETGEWDPVAGFDEADGAGDSSEEEEALIMAQEEEKKKKKRSKQEEEAKRRNSSSNNNNNSGSSSSSTRAGRWIKREVELTDSPRQFGFCVDGMDVTVRVEPR